MLCVTLLASLVFVDGCKKDDAVVTPEDKTVPNDVFPLTAGDRFDYTGYFTNADTETPLSGNTNTYYSTSWTLGSSVTPLNNIFGPTYGALVSANNGGRLTASLILDSTLIGPPLTPVGVTFRNLHLCLLFMILLRQTTTT